MYALAVILAWFPLLDLFTATWPFRFADLPWRYAALGVAANYLYLSLVGIALAMGVAHWREHGFVMSVAGWLCLLVAVVLVPVMFLFALDVLAIIDLRAAELARDTMLAGAIQEAKYAGTLLVMALLGWGARETRRRSARAGDRATAPVSPGAIRRSAG